MGNASIFCQVIVALQSSAREISPLISLVLVFKVFSYNLLLGIKQWSPNWGSRATCGCLLVFIWPVGHYSSHWYETLFFPLTPKMRHFFPTDTYSRTLFLPLTSLWQQWGTSSPADINNGALFLLLTPNNGALHLPLIPMMGQYSFNYWPQGLCNFFTPTDHQTWDIVDYHWCWAIF